MDHHRFLHAQLVQYLSHRFHQVGIIDAQKEEIGIGGVREGSQDVEYRAEAQFPADRSYILHGCMVLLGEKEAHAHLLQHIQRFFGVLGNIGSQRFLHIGSAALGRSGPVAVLGHLHAPCCHHESGGGGNVEAVGLIASGTYDFKDFHTGMGNRNGMFPHGRCAAGNLINGFRLGALGR